MLTLILLLASLSGVVQPRGEFPLLGTNTSHVLVVKNPAATRAFAPQPDAIRAMVSDGLTHFTAKATVREAWHSLVSTQDVIGIKVHSAPGRTSGTRPAVVAAFLESILGAGISPKQVIIWDRRTVDLRLAGFYELAERYGVVVTGAVEEGFDPDVSYSSPLLGKLVYGDLEFGRKGEGIGRKSHLSNLLTRKVTKIINLTPLLNHNLAGASGALYGLAMASVDNVLRFEQSDRLATAVPEIYALPEISDRVVLNVVDALICQYQGEERSLLHYSSALNELWFSRDPVAVDVLALQELERQKGEETRKTAWKQIYFNAGLMELGTADPSNIRVERLAPKAQR